VSSLSLGTSVGTPPGTPVAAARVVLVTGVSRFLGARVASVLQADPSIERVIGVDTVPPRTSLGRAEFVAVDLRTPSVGEVIDAARVDTVVHAHLVTAPSVPRARVKEFNVIGTLQLLAACQRSPDVRRLVVRSSAGVYGSSPRDPAVFTERDEPVEAPASGYAKDAVEVEGYVRGLGRRRPDLSVSVLRFANFLGHQVDSPLTRYLRLPVVPTLLGFDPRLQFVHPDDGVEVMRRMTLGDHPGVYNVAGDGVLLMSQALRRVGRPYTPVPSLSLSMLGDLGRHLVGRAGFAPEFLRWLSHGRVVDIERLATELTWRPKHTTEATLAAFAETTPGMGRPLIDRLTSILGSPR
jgi:UDP-glucose 4-epimerase